VVFSLAFSPDGKTLASRSDDHPVKLWSIAIGKLVAEFTERQEVRCVAFSPDGTLLASADDAGTVRLRRATPLEPRGPATACRPRAGPGSDPEPLTQREATKGARPH